MSDKQYELFMWISVGILGLEIICYLPLKVFILKRYLKQKNKENGLMAIFNYAISGTIFTYVDNLNSENTQVSLNRLSSNSARKQSSIGTPTMKREIHYEEYNSAIICDCYECCCEGCPWEMKSDWTQKLGKYLEKIQNKILHKLKLIGFITIELLSYFYLPLNNLVYFSNNLYCITFFGILFQTLQFYVLCFTFSFITTKREMVRLDSDTDRGLLTYYHLRKSQIFSVMTLFVLIVLSFILKNQFENKEISLFIFCNSFYTFASYSILFLLLRFNKCLRNDLIQDNDNILKGEQKLHTIENNLIKYFPSATEFQQYINQNDSELDPEELNENINQIMEQKCTEAKQNLQNSLQAVEKQQFKKIKKNLGVKKLSITILTLYIYINLFLLTPISAIVCLQIMQNKQDKDLLYSNICVLLYQILNIIQFTFYPFMLGIMFNKRALFGQDYGQWESNQ